MMYKPFFLRDLDYYLRSKLYSGIRMWAACYSASILTVKKNFYWLPTVCPHWDRFCSEAQMNERGYCL